MANTTYTNFTTPAIDAGWLNDVNNVTYNLLGNGTSAPTNVSDVKNALGGLGTMAPQNANAVAITGGSITGTSFTGNITGNASGTSSNVTGTVAVANGGTGDTGTAWSSSSLTITSGAGTITTASGTVRYKQMGKTVWFTLQITITNNGTGSGNINFSGLPFTTAAFFSTAAGREVALTGKAVTMTLNPSTSGGVVQFYDNTYAGASGANIIVSGVLETA